ncbi:sulfotransferase family protein [Rhodovulum bhavnagarense]|uniref:Sulfotransferase family protein n=1 Tax=Rhodovulum bhavnagarense TaxID=992286 RepID=A0A4R2RI30_9RHOB|nr:sulfotransferase [Rhodovulum bhavnagarense]TCP63422.1 sulfotransferase family protein [Rhodovulum bhavnagarense]
MRQPLFIICPGRTFSSVVCSAIGQHPEAYGLPEVNLFVRDTVGELMASGRVGAITGLKRTIAELNFGAQTVETVEAATAWIEERGAMSGAQMLRLLGELSGGRMIVDKTPTNSQEKALLRIAEAFPEARFLHLTRHPRATLRSQYKAIQSRRGKIPRKMLIEATGRWLERHRWLVEFGAALGPGQYLCLHGEWFFEDPRRILEQVCDWAELSRAPGAVERMMHPEESPYARPGPENAPYGNNPGFMENPHLRIGAPSAETLDGPLEWLDGLDVYFDAETRQLAHQLGYAG